MNASMLFVPGIARDKFVKACQSEAGALILDLEDSVAGDRKADARAAVVDMLRQGSGRQTLWVRVNPQASGLLLQDLAAVLPARPFGIMLPKCCGRESLLQVAAYLDALEVAHGIEPGQTRLLPIVTETAASLFRLGELAGATPRLWGMAWGAEDLATDVGSLSNADAQGYTEPFRLARSLCLFAAAAAGVRPVDTVCVALRDEARVLKESQDACRDGFVAKMAIHPAQLAPINEGFTPSPERVEWARRVVAAFQANPGLAAHQLDGKMIDEPHLKLARRILEGNR
ncbi:CoA ester lyase [Variovorax sp.]|uniref:HpcH/HpaI aldolase/citrate lyase family protein n=1 Tax=Variovorax sp. TaxID=1871043 RepID=UPI002D2C12D0|nr:CoA ester lyase [Variovorax sp.]HYP82601.1 CoA ester lyase [Variovorax sp.]